MKVYWAFDLGHQQECTAVPYNDALSCFPKKLNSPTLSVNSEGFIPMLAKLDDCIAYISSHVSNSVLILV